MIQRQVELGRSWEVHYACRAAEYAAFLEDITAADGDAVGKVKLHLDSESGGQVLDIKAIVDKAQDGSIFSCCGPAAMLEAYKQATAAVPSASVRHNHFGAAASTADTGPRGAFTLRHTQRGRT